MVASLSLKPVKAEDLYIRQLPAVTSRAFVAASKLPLFSGLGWYLAGGTALSLQVGHRQSIDLDFFTTHKNFSVPDMEEKLETAGQWETTLRRKKTLYGTFLKAKMSFIAYPFFQPAAERLECGYVRILTPSDIAAMKIVAISQRGRKRDFVDLYWYCLNREPLGAVIYRATKQYPGQERNLPHIIKSLTYFADAETEPMPRLFFKADWRTIKTYFQREAPKVAREFLGLK